MTKRIQPSNRLLSRAVTGLARRPGRMLHGTLVINGSAPPSFALHLYHTSPFTDPSSGKTFDSSAQACYYHQALVIEELAIPRTRCSLEQVMYNKLSAANVTEWIMNADSVHSVKEIIQQFASPTDDTIARLWKDRMFEVLQAVTYLKFSANQDERAWLLFTGERELVDASLDRDLGIGYLARDAEDHRHEWGKNLHGQSLMIVRDRLKSELYENPTCFAQQDELPNAHGLPERLRVGAFFNKLL